MDLPPEIFVDLDAIFGFCNKSKEENQFWDKDFIDHLYEWVNRDSRERLFGLDLTFDFRLALETLTRDETETQSEFTDNHSSQIYIPVEEGFYEEYLIHFFSKTSMEGGNEFSEYEFNNGFRNKQEFHYASYRKKAQNFFNFAAAGGTKDFKIPIKTT